MPNEFQAVCLYCKKSFSFNNKKERKYCSKSCALKDRAKNNKKNIYEDRNCAICNKIFNIRKKKRTITCSRKCGAKHAGLNKKLEIEKRICKSCGEEFSVKSSSQRKTCSRSCGVKNNWDCSSDSIERRKIHANRMKDVGKNNFGKKPWNDGVVGAQEAWNKIERVTFKCSICHRDYKSYLKNENPRKRTCGANYCRQAKVKLPLDHNVNVDDWIEPTKKFRCKICAKEFEVRLGRSGRIKGWNHKRGKGKTKILTCSEECYNQLRAMILVNHKGKSNDTKPELEMEKLLKESNIKYKKQYWQRDSKRIVFYDFILWDYNLLLEVDGDYWHANPKIYSSMNEAQRKNVNNDKYKEKLAKDRGFLIFRAWESEIPERFKKLKILLKSLGRGN